MHNYLDLARVVSLHSNFRIRIGAVIVRRGTPIAVGWNNAKSSPKCYGLCATIHAETSALASILKVDVRGSTIYVARFYKDGSAALAKPCSHCWTMLKVRGIRWVVFTTSIPPFYCKERIC